ncbi:acid protease [Daedalea quercina L-15889]|uniref:Acid protease n=1 Tax=Daedalea quercina L-15889 TaxID=1314783 RepID=A0A165QG72_9APHY|nr:acid protease [Daedalea quercina L-15889]
MLLQYLFCILSASYACALWIPITRQSNTQFTTSVFRNPQADSNVGFSNVKDSLYSATIKVNGRPFQVQVDSGSSELWIDPAGLDLPELHHTGLNSGTAYVDGTSAGGEIVLGNVTFGEFTVVNQALVLAPGSNATYEGLMQGVLGVGPYGGSQIYNTLNGTPYNGQNLVTNIFNSLLDEAPYMTFLLSRTNTGVAKGGVLSIGELVSNLTRIIKTPKLPVVAPCGWLTMSGGVLVNDKYHPAYTVPTATGSKSVAIFDTGTTVGQLPRAVVDFIYKDIPGAVWDESQSTYKLPCQSKLNMSMIFGGVALPIHPIDAIIVGVADSGIVTCYAAFEAADNGVMVLGDTFMRNVYTLLNFGDQLTHRGGNEPAYIQLLSVTDPEQAWNEFDQLNVKRIEDMIYDKFAREPLVRSSAALTTSPTASRYTLVGHVTIAASATATPTSTYTVQ